MNYKSIKYYWTIAYWILFFSWILGAALFMARFHGGFLTNYLSDLTFPAWFYIYIRGKIQNDQIKPHLLLVGSWFGESAERAAISIFIVGALTEIKTLFWPQGPIAGTFDILDICAYAFGLIACYSFDKWNISIDKDKQNQNTKPG